MAHKAMLADLWACLCALVLELPACTSGLSSFSNWFWRSNPMLLLCTWLRYLCSSSHSCMLSSQYPISTEFHDLPIYGSSTILKAIAKNGCYISQWVNGDFFNVGHHPFKPRLAPITEKMAKHILSNIKD